MSAARYGIVLSVLALALAGCESGDNQGDHSAAAPDSWHGWHDRDASGSADRGNPTGSGRDQIREAAPDLDDSSPADSSDDSYQWWTV